MAALYPRKRRINEVEKSFIEAHLSPIESGKVFEGKAPSMSTLGAESEGGYYRY